MRSQANQKKSLKTWNHVHSSKQKLSTQFNSSEFSVVQCNEILKYIFLHEQQQIKRYTNHQPKQSIKTLPGTVILLLLLLHLHFGRKPQQSTFTQHSQKQPPTQSHLQNLFLSFSGFSIMQLLLFLLCCFCYYQLHSCWSIITITTITVGTYRPTYLPTYNYLPTYD
jgi:hypothetical protein